MIFHAKMAKVTIATIIKAGARYSKIIACLFSQLKELGQKLQPLGDVVFRHYASFLAFLQASTTSDYSFELSRWIRRTS